MQLSPWEFRDPEAVVTDVLRRTTVIDGDVVLALVQDPSTKQDVLDVVRIPPESHNLDQFELSRLLADTAEAMPLPDRWSQQSPHHSIVTIVGRQGFAIIGPAEANWSIAWRYANPMVRVSTGDLIVVTPHGWTDLMSGWGWYEPQLSVAPPSDRLVEQEQRR